MEVSTPFKYRYYFNVVTYGYTLPYISACFKLYKRDFLLNNNLFFKEGIIAEDAEIFYRIYSKVKSIAVLNYPFYHYRKGIHSITTAKPTRLYFHSYYQCAQTYLIEAKTLTNDPILREEILLRASMFLCGSFLLYYELKLNDPIFLDFFYHNRKSLFVKKEQSKGTILKHHVYLKTPRKLMPIALILLPILLSILGIVARIIKKIKK